MTKLSVEIGSLITKTSGGIQRKSLQFRLQVFKNHSALFNNFILLFMFELKVVTLKAVSKHLFNMCFRIIIFYFRFFFQMNPLELGCVELYLETG